MTGIYKITNKVNGHFYIGASRNIKKRWNEHRKKTNVLKGTSAIAKAYREFGLGNFLFEVIEECSVELLKSREEFYIANLKPQYNTSETGYAEKVFTDSVLKKLSQSGKSQWEQMSEEQKSDFVSHNLQGPRKGHEVSEETRNKIRLANIGKKQSAVTIELRARKTKRSMIGNTNGNKCIIATADNGAFVAYFCSVKTAGEYYGVHPSTITGVLKGRRKRACGYKWFYVSVETNRDECNGVGVILSHVEVRDNRKVEEIVHAQEMGNLGISDKGIAQLSIRSGQFKTINVTDVREGELKGRDRRTGYVTIEWIEDEKKRNNADVIGYLGYFKLLNGYEKESYWSMEELQKHGVQYSQTYKKGYGVWKDNFDAMAKKTVLKLMLNKGDAPMSVQMQQAIKYDQSVILDENGTARYIDNQAKPSNEEQVQQFLNAEEAQVVENPTEAAETAEPAKPEGGSNLFDGKE